MEVYKFVFCFVSGMFVANTVPHFVHGISGNRFPTPFARPHGKGLSSPVLNILWSLFNMAIAYVFFRIGGVSTSDTLSLLLFFTGIAASGIILSLHFTKKDKE